MNGGSGLVHDHALPWRDPELRREVARMRRLGHHGGAISPHRALLTSPVPARTWLPAIGLSLAFFAGWLLLRYPVSRAWAGLLDFWRAVIGLGGHVTQVPYDFHGLLRFDIPYLHFGAGLPSNWLWWIGLFLTLGLVIVPLLLPRRLLPLIYLLRVFALFQAGAQLFFAFWPEAFPYEASGYVHGMLIASFMFVAITPLLLGLTYYILDFSVAKKIALTALLMGHLFLLIPLQYLAHAWIIHHLSLLFLPFVFFVCGLPVQVLTFIAFYAWGASWRSRLREADAWWEARRVGRNGNGNGHGAGARHAVVVALLAGAAAGAGLLPGVAGVARAEPPAPPRGGLVEAGGGFSRYTEGLGDADVQFARLILAPRAAQQWRFEVAREKRFGDQSWNYGLLWTRLLAGGASVSVGACRGTGDYIAPDYRVDLGAAVPLAGFVLNPGVNFIRSKAANRSAGVGLGVLRYAGPWLLAAHGRADFGEPGGTTSTAFGGGVTYLVWRRTHIGAGAEWGDISYQLVGPGEALVDYRSHAYHMALSQWFDARTGLNLRLDYGDTPFYVVRGAALSLFREW